MSKTYRKPRTKVTFNTGTRRHKTSKDYARKPKFRQQLEAE